MNYIMDTLDTLTEMSHKYFVDTIKNKCTCGKNSSLNAKDHKGSCPCRKTLSFFAEHINEGMMKRDLEAKVEKKCNCDGGASLDPEDHADDCPAKELLDNPGSEIDAAEYQIGDR